MTMRDGQVCRVGVDLVHVSDVAQSVARFGPRYLNRVYTPHEIACATRRDQYDHGVLAARFAAKEAAIKVLRPDGSRPPWRDIEVRRLPSGACELHLTSSAASLARAQGITSTAVSVTHEGDTAASVVIATCDGVAQTAAGQGQGQGDGDGDGRHHMSDIEMNQVPVEPRIQEILREFGQLSVDPADIDQSDDLFDAGMTSHASVNVMLALEEAFEVEFPEALLRKQTFESVSAIAAALSTLGVQC
jgi:phosphopantetheine--protein transferase-like protein